MKMLCPKLCCSDCRRISIICGLNRGRARAARCNAHHTYPAAAAHTIHTTQPHPKVYIFSPNNPAPIRNGRSIHTPHNNQTKKNRNAARLCGKLINIAYDDERRVNVCVCVDDVLIISEPEQHFDRLTDRDCTILIGD